MQKVHYICCIFVLLAFNVIKYIILVVFIYNLYLVVKNINVVNNLQQKASQNIFFKKLTLTT